MRAVPGAWVGSRCCHGHSDNAERDVHLDEGLRFLPSSQPAGSTQGGTPVGHRRAGLETFRGNSGRRARARVGAGPTLV